MPQPTSHRSQLPAARPETSLPDDRNHRERGGERENRRVRERFELHLHPGHHEEDRHDEVPHRVDEVFEVAPAMAIEDLADLRAGASVGPLDRPQHLGADVRRVEVLEVHLLEDQPGGERADDRREPDEVREVREHEAERERDR